MWLCWAVIRTFKKKKKALYSVLYSLQHQHKLNLRNKAGWRLHFAVHAYCAFYGWKYDTSLNPTPTSQLSNRNRPQLSLQTGRTVQPWAGGSKRVQTMMTFCKAYRLIPSTVTRNNTIAPTPLAAPGIKDPAIHMQGQAASTGHGGSTFTGVLFYHIHGHVLFYKKADTEIRHWIN